MGGMDSIDRELLEQLQKVRKKKKKKKSRRKITNQPS